MIERVENNRKKETAARRQRNRNIQNVNTPDRGNDPTYRLENETTCTRPISTRFFRWITRNSGINNEVMLRRRRADAAAHL